METRLATRMQNLPALPRDAEIIGWKLLRVLDRLGFEHKNKDGEFHNIRFSRAALCRGEVALYWVDTERLYRFATPDLVAPRVLDTMSDAVGFDVHGLRLNGLAFAVELVKPAKPKALPKLCSLAPDARPPGLALPVPIGETATGSVWRDLPQLGHVLLAGTTGSGKTTWLHASLAALLNSTTPDALQVVLIDAKRSEMTIWAHAPHVIGAVAYTEAHAARALGDMVREINRRGDLFVAEGVREWKAYNRKATEPLPALLVVIDEALDLVLEAGARSELVSHVKTIAMRGRSTGVYLWLATQHAAAVAGLPRVVGVNLVTRLVFRVADRSAAEVAGCPGAERLPADCPGRLLAKVGGVDPTEAQAYNLSDADLAKLTGDMAGKGDAGAPSLSDFERELVRFAWEKLSGAFSVGKLAAQFSKGKDAINTLAARWEARGWLTSPRARNDPRRLTVPLLHLAGIEPAQAGHQSGCG